METSKELLGTEFVLILDPYQKLIYYILLTHILL